LTAEELTEHFNRKIASALRRDAGASGIVVKSMALDSALPSAGPISSPHPTSVAVAEVGATEDSGLCPKCGNKKYRRSRRRWYERWLKRPRMARCLKCAHRYPYPS
jgi:hypothetical protein